MQKSHNKENDDMSLGGRIRIGMAMRGILTPADLARRMNMHRQTIHKWLDGSVTELSPDNLFALADVLGVSARWLGIRDGPPQKPVILDLDRSRVIAILDSLEASPGLQEAWINSGNALATGAKTPQQSNPMRIKHKV